MEIIKAEAESMSFSIAIRKVEAVFTSVPFRHKGMPVRPLYLLSRLKNQGFQIESAKIFTFKDVSAQLLIIVYMYFGRVGVLTISMGFLAGDKAEERYQYAQTSLLIG